MNTDRIAVLPMYDFPHAADAHCRLWEALAGRLTRLGVSGVPARLSPDIGEVASWQHPDLLLGQACEYPLLKTYGAGVRIVATPCYTAPGCTGSHYRSAIVVRTTDPAQTLADLRSRRCVINSVDSNSGMNLLRAAIAPLARGGAFFESVSVSGSHRASATRVADGTADVAAIDCVTLAHLAHGAGALVARLRILAWTASSPGLPLITARRTSDTTLRALRAALADIAGDATLAPQRELLLLRGFDFQTDEQLRVTAGHEQLAQGLGYPLLR